ncbi:hypothetical protein C1646_755212 [Rhizophagus diaphanus]|nr:hypothetical protein C1646_755212 [Rhizophagus diaphanus] [Rhizophagus sp. MUCL 43196]
MSAITTKFVIDHRLTNEMSLEELSQYTPEILELLTTGVPKVDKEKRRQAHDRLQKGYKFSKEQAYALIPHKRIGRSKNQVIPKEGGSEAEEVNICQVSFDNTCFDETIKETAQHIVWDNLSERDLRDPGKPRSTYLSTFLKKDEFIPKMESHKPLLFSSLCKLGSVFASVAHRPKNPLKANTYASEALQHLPDNHTSPSKRYTIVNMRKRGEPYNQAEPFCIFNEN